MLRLADHVGRQRLLSCRRHVPGHAACEIRRRLGLLA
jgi:hypothetical protein